MTIPDCTDVAILGGGLAGLSLAVQIKNAKPSCSVIVVERSQHPPPTAAHKVGESTVELAAHYFSKVLGLEDYLKTEQLPKYGLRFFLPSNANSTDLADSVEVGVTRYLPTPSFQLDRGLFEAHLGKVAAAQGTFFIDGALVSDVTLSEKSDHIIRFATSNKEHQVNAKWVIDATGRVEFLKRRHKLSRAVEHSASAIWFRVDAKLNIDDWSSASGWLDGHEGEQHSRWLSTNHLMGTGYWVWIIPLASGTTSIGIVADEAIHPVTSFNTLEKAIGWLQEHEPVCASVVQAHTDAVMDFRVMKNYSRNATQVFSRQRWCLTGEAGAFVDPFYSPGSDFIAMSNTFICDLICRDVDGECIAQRASIYNELYRDYVDNTFVVFHKQYALFGNPTVMPIKIIWDFTVYWVFFAHIFCHGRLCDLTSFVQTRPAFEKIRQLNGIVQERFLAWHQSNPARPAPTLIDLPAVDFLARLNAELMDELDMETYVQRMTDNVELLEELAAEITAAANGEVDPDSSPHLEGIWRQLGVLA
jgi:flavin-dependent dehydrogenase